MCVCYNWFLLPLHERTHERSFFFDKSCFHFVPVDDGFFVLQNSFRDLKNYFAESINWRKQLNNYYKKEKEEVKSNKLAIYMHNTYIYILLSKFCNSIHVEVSHDTFPPTAFGCFHFFFSFICSPSLWFTFCEMFCIFNYKWTRSRAHSLSPSLHMVWRLPFLNILCWEFSS